MKPSAIVGIVLVVLGAVILFTGGGLGFYSQRSMMRMGDFQVSAGERHVVPSWPLWVGGVTILGGLLVVGAGVRQRSAG